MRLRLSLDDPRAPAGVAVRSLGEHQASTRLSVISMVMNPS